MKKRGILIVVVICFISLFTGCQKTPEEVIVKQKGQQDISDYEKEEAAGESGEGSALLAEELQAPATYQAEVESDDGKLKLAIDAKVNIPEVDRVPVYKVSGKEFTQDFINTVTKTFFGDAPVYDEEEYYAMTKEEIKAWIADLKERLASGEFDAEEYGGELTEEEYKIGLQTAIDDWEKEYETASETVVKNEVTPEMTLDGKRYVVEVDQENIYAFNIQDFNGNSISIKKSHPQFNNMTVLWSEYQALKEASDDAGNSRITQTESELEALAGITMEEAKVTADEKVASLELSGIELYNKTNTRHPAV